MLAEMISGARNGASGLVPRSRLLWSMLTYRHDVEKHGNAVPWFVRVWLSLLMQLFNAKTSLSEGPRVSL